MVAATKPRLLVIGGQFSGNFCAREMKSRFNVTVVDAKEYFEYTPGILRAYVKPAHLDALTFTLQPVLERKMGVKFIWGEVKELDGIGKKAKIQTMFSPQSMDEVEFDYCIICAGTNFGMLSPMGESLWFATIHEEGRKVSEWAHIDERFIEGRRRHILEEYHRVKELNARSAKLLIVGAGFIGVEWATELQHFFPNLAITIMDMLPRCLGPLPDVAAAYCSEYMSAVGIVEKYKTKYAPKEDSFWQEIGLPNDTKAYVCMGVKASNYFMPKNTLTRDWITINEYLQVCEAPNPSSPPHPGCKDIGNVWGDGTIYAVGDCNTGGICHLKDPKAGPRGGFEGPLMMIPKISYPGEEQALHACVNVKRMLKGKGNNLHPTWWPWGAGMFATSLGPHDACFVLGANDKPGSGWMVNWWIWAALQKEVIETTKINECKDVWIGVLIWHFVHHTPCNCWGKGPCFPACPGKKGIDKWRREGK